MIKSNPAGPTGDEQLFTLCKKVRVINHSSIREIVDALENWHYREETKIDEALYSHQHVGVNLQELRKFVTSLPVPKRYGKYMGVADAVRYWDDIFDKLVERSFRTVVQSVASFSSMEELKQWFSDNNGIETYRIFTKANETTPFIHSIELCLNIDDAKNRYLGGLSSKRMDINLDDWFIIETSAQFHFAIEKKYKVLHEEAYKIRQAICDAQDAARLEELRLKEERKAKRAAKKAEREAALAEASK